MNRKMYNLLLKIIITTLHLKRYECESSTSEIFQYFTCYYDGKMNRYDVNECIYKDINAVDPINVPLIYAESDNPRPKPIFKIVFEKCTIPQITSEFFEKHEQSETVQMAGILLHRLSSDSFNKLDSLKSINISNNLIEKMPEDIFLTNFELRTLDVSYNQISTLEFINPHLKRIEELILSHNKILKLDSEFLVSQRKLQKLYLGNNQIDEFPMDILENKWDLKDLKLNGNPFTSGLKYPDLLDIRRLRYIDISNIRLHSTTIEVNFLEVTVNNCNLTEVSLGDVIEVLKATHNQISNVIIYPDNFAIFDIDLSYNNLTSIANLSNLVSLEKLDISYNCISNLGFEIFRNLSNLKELNLKHTCLTNVDLKTFGRSTNLQSLDISFNKLNQFDFYTLYTLVSLQQLYLFGNHINNSSGTEDIISILPNLKKIEFFSGYWECYPLANIIGQLLRRKVEVISPPSVEEINETTDYIEGIPCSFNSQVPDIDFTRPHFNESELSNHIERTIKIAVDEYSELDENSIENRYPSDNIMKEALNKLDEQRNGLKIEINEIINNFTGNYLNYEDLINVTLSKHRTFINDLVADVPNLMEGKFTEILLKISEGVKELQLQGYVTNDNDYYQTPNLIDAIYNNRRIKYNGTFILS